MKKPYAMLRERMDRLRLDIANELCLEHVGKFARIGLPYGPDVDGVVTDVLVDDQNFIAIELDNSGYHYYLTTDDSQDFEILPEEEE